MHLVPSHFVLSILPAVQQGGAHQKIVFVLKWPWLTQSNFDLKQYRPTLLCNVQMCMYLKARVPATLNFDLLSHQSIF